MKPIIQTCAFLLIAGGVLLSWACAQTPGQLTKDTPQTPPATDVLGDPLPMGAVARFGTVRFRFTHGVAKAVFSNDGKSIFGVGAGDSTSITAWEFPSGKVLRRYEVDKSHIGGVTVAPDGKTLFASVNGIAALEVGSGLVTKRFGGEPKGSGHLTVSPDGKWLAHVVEPTSSRVRIREVETGKDVHLLPTTKGIISSLTFSPDSRKLAVVGDGRGVEIWEMATGKLRETYKPAGFTPHQAVFTPNGKWLVAEGSKTIRILEVISGKELRRFGIDQVFVSGLAVTSDSKTLAVPNGAGKVTLWDLTTGLEIRTVNVDHRGTVTRVGFSPDDRVLLTTCTSEHVGLWDVATGRALHPQIGHVASVVSMAITPDDRTLISSDGSDTLRVWDLATGIERRQIKTIRRATHIALSSDGNKLAAFFGGAKDDLLLHLLNVGNGQALKSFGTDLRFVNAIALSPDGGTLAVAASGDNISLWDPNTGQPKGQLTAKGSGAVSSVAFSPDGRFLLTGQSNNKEAWLWDVATLRVVHKLRHEGRVKSVAFAPDGRTAITGGGGDSAILWNVASGKEMKRFIGHGGEVMKVAISPDGKLLATTGIRGRGIRLWDIATGIGLVEFGNDYALYNLFTTLTFSNNGKLLITGRSDSSLLSWDVASVLDKYKLVAIALSPKELDAYWVDLASGDAAKAGLAMRVLAGSPDQAVAFLQKSIAPGSPSKEWSKLLADLDAKEFPVREKATAALQQQGHAAVPAMHNALKAQPSQEVRTRLEMVLKKLGVSQDSLNLREIRAVEVLEQIGTAQAKKTLQLWATQFPNNIAGSEAKAALQRLGK